MYFLLAIVLIAAPAEPPLLPPVLTLQDALRLFHERSFDLLLADALLAAARGDEALARAIPNPAVNGSVGNSFGYDASTCPSPGCSSISIGAGLSDQAALSDLLFGLRDGQPPPPAVTPTALVPPPEAALAVVLVEPEPTFLQLASSACAEQYLPKQPCSAPSWISPACCSTSPARRRS